MKLLRVIAINLGVFALLAEAVALAIYYFETGWLYYARAKPYALIEETASEALTADALHPYFGPIHKPGYRAITNNFGFDTRQNFPLVKTSADQFIVGIFGGSVAKFFCDFGAGPMIERLKTNRFFAGRQIIPLCVSHEGYKQPQQAILTTYFLSIGQQFDIVINIDGFNEVVFGRFNNDRGRDISMPSPIHLDALVNVIDHSTLTAEKLYSLAAINRNKERLNALTDAIRRNRIASVNFVLERLHQRTLDAYRFERARFGNFPKNPPAASIVEVTPAVKVREGQALYEDIAAQWVNSSVLMHDVLAARSVEYFHILQPNQYFTRRRFTEEEDQLARNPETPFRPPVEHGYPALIAASQSLVRKVNFFSAVDVFDSEVSPVYEDDCCHYNERGNRLLADFIAARILATPGVWSGTAHQR